MIILHLLRRYSGSIFFLHRTCLAQHKWLVWSNTNAMFKYEHLNEEVHVAADPRLAQQSLARTLSQAECEFACALEEIFTSGDHAISLVAKALQERGIARPSGDVAPWSEAILTEELARINSSLDAAYATSGIGA
jgi:hypothetical protein